MRTRPTYLLMSLISFTGVILILAACSDTSGVTTGGSTDLPLQVQDARVLIRDDYPEASYYRVKMNYTRDDENVNAWTNNSDWIYLTSKWVVIANRDLPHAACILVHEWWHTKGYGEGDSEAKEAECLSTI